MDLVERYLNAIRPLLPGEQKDDIIAELADEIRSRIEDQEAQFGRKLNDSEIEALLKAMGSPLAVAARYGPGRHLIGPAVYPVYMLALKAVLLIMAAAEVIGLVVKTTVDAAQGKPLSFATRLGEAWADFWVGGFFMIGLITVIAAVVERANPGLEFDNLWKPQHLPRPSRRALAREARQARRLRRPPSRVDAAFGVAFHVVCFFWLLGFVEAGDVYPPFLSPEHWLETTAGLALTPIWWDRLFAWMLAGVAAQVIVYAVLFLRPQSQRAYAGAKLFNDLVGIGFAITVARAGELFTAAPDAIPSPKALVVYKLVSEGLHLAFTFVAVFLALDALYRLWRLAGPKRGPAAPIA